MLVVEPFCDPKTSVHRLVREGRSLRYQCYNCGKYIDTLEKHFLTKIPLSAYLLLHPESSWWIVKTRTSRIWIK